MLALPLGNINSKKKFQKKFVACLKFQSEANRTRLLHSFFSFRIRIRFRGVILYRELSAASTAAFPTNLLEINRAFSHREWRVPRPEDIRFDSQNRVLKNAAVALANATEANFASHSSLVSLSKAGLALALALFCSWPGQNSWKLQVTATL